MSESLHTNYMLIIPPSAFQMASKKWTGFFFWLVIPFHFHLYVGLSHVLGLFFIPVFCFSCFIPLFISFILFLIFFIFLALFLCFFLFLYLRLFLCLDIGMR
jgi:hypothetical protein